MDIKINFSSLTEGVEMICTIMQIHPDDNWILDRLILSIEDQSIPNISRGDSSLNRKKISVPDICN